MESRPHAPRARARLRLRQARSAGVPRRGHGGSRPRSRTPGRRQDARAGQSRQSHARIPEPVRHRHGPVDDGYVRRDDLQRARRREEGDEEMKRAVLVIICALVGPVLLEAQRGGGAPQPPRAPRAAAPIDLTGYWVSIVTQDWRWRMVTPRKGDYQGVQMTPEAAKVADAWDPAKDEAAGEQCKSYGAPALMSVPGRLHITWQDDTTLKRSEEHTS